MADYSTDNLKQSQQFLQAYDKLYSFKNTFYDLLASLEKNTWSHRIFISYFCDSTAQRKTFSGCFSLSK